MGIETAIAGASLAAGIGSQVAGIAGSQKESGASRGRSQREALFNLAVQKNARNRDILARRRDPFIQAAGTTLLSQFTNLTPEQAQATLRDRAAQDNPFTETRSLRRPGQVREQIRQGARLRDALRSGNAPPNVGADPFNVTRPLPPGARTRQANRGFVPPIAALGAEATGTQVGAGATVQLQNTDVIGQDQLQNLRSLEQSQAAGLFSRAATEFGNQQAARGISGGVAPSSLLGAAGRQLQSGVSQRAGQREIQAAQINRQALTDILGQFQEFGSFFEGSFT